MAAQQLPVANLLAYDDLKRAILQRVGRSPEQHRQRFRSMELGDNGQPFVLAQQLRDACRKWLMAEPRDVEGVIDLVVQEQFIAQLPRRTAEWVQCHRPTSLTQAIQLAEDHLVVCPGVGEPLSLFPSPPSLPSQHPIPGSRLHEMPLGCDGERWKIPSHKPRAEGYETEILAKFAFRDPVNRVTCMRKTQALNALTVWVFASDESCAWRLTAAILHGTSPRGEQSSTEAVAKVQMDDRRM